MVNNYSKWLLFRCLCALIMVASFFATMIPAAIVQTYLAGTTCEGSIKQPSDQSSGVKQIIHPANVTNHDERDYVSVGLFAFIAGGVIVGTVLQATEFEHAAVTAVCAGGFFVLSTVQISSMLSTARDARSLDENTIAQILEAPVLEGDFCRTPILQDVEGVNAEAWTCALTAVLRGKDGWGSVQRACNSSVRSSVFLTIRTGLTVG